MAPNSDNFNSDELEAPEWLNEELLTEVLRSCEQDDTIELKQLQFSPASAKGDHYASIMFRAAVEFESRHREGRQTKSLVIKTLPEVEGKKKELLGESYIFQTEIGVYTEVIPRFESILRSIGDDTVLGAKCLYHSLSPHQIIIFEDLVELGYTVLRDRQVNMEEARAIYRKLAKWHAISYKLIQEEPEFFDKYQHPLLTMPKINDLDMITKGIDLFVDMLDSQPQLAKYKPLFEAMKPELLKRCKASCTEYRDGPREGAHYVLNHGDFHFKNMMFKHRPADGRFEDVMMLDFQMSFVGPMVMDVIYSFFMVMDAEMRVHHQDELVHYFFEHFLETLRRIGFKGRLPRLVELREMLLRHRHFDIFMLLTFLPFFYNFTDKDTADVEQYITSEDFRKIRYCQEPYLRELELLLPRYLHQGYLDL